MVPFLTLYMRSYFEFARSTGNHLKNLVSDLYRIHIHVLVTAPGSTLLYVPIHVLPETYNKLLIRIEINVSEVKERNIIFM